jgi:hypothetical protein
MAHWVKNEECPQCRKQGKDRSQDNLGRFSDGGAYCWSCQYREGPTRASKPAKEKRTIVYKHWTPNLPKKNVQWLDLYGLTAEEKQVFRYNPENDRHVYPVYQNGKCIFYEERSVDPEVSPKSLQYGDKPIHIMGRGSVLVIVEDIVSAMKVSRHAKAVPLWGSNMPMEWIPYIKGQNCKVAVWLDEDKYVAAIELARRLNLVSVQTSVIRTANDPKCLFDDEIKIMLDKI